MLKAILRSTYMVLVLLQASVSANRDLIGRLVASAVTLVFVFYAIQPTVFLKWRLGSCRSSTTF